MEIETPVLISSHCLRELSQQRILTIFFLTIHYTKGVTNYNLFFYSKTVVSVYRNGRGENMEEILKEILKELKELKHEIQVIASNSNPITVNIEETKTPEQVAVEIKSLINKRENFNI